MQLWSLLGRAKTIPITPTPPSYACPSNCGILKVGSCGNLKMVRYSGLRVRITVNLDAEAGLTPGFMTWLPVRQGPWMVLVVIGSPVVDHGLPHDTHDAPAILKRIPFARDVGSFHPDVCSFRSRRLSGARLRRPSSRTAGRSNPPSDNVPPMRTQR